MKNKYYIILKILLFSICLAPIDATTEDGQKVILHNDGTWKFENPAENAKFNLIEFVDSHFEKHEKHYGREEKPYEAHVRGFFQFQNNSDRKVVAIKYKFSLVDAFDDVLYDSIVKDNIKSAYYERSLFNINFFYKFNTDHQTILLASKE